MRVMVNLQQLARIKAAKENRTVNTVVIAAETGLARNTVADYWYDRVQRLDKRVLERLCDYLQCDLEMLIIDGEQSKSIYRTLADA